MRTRYFLIDEDGDCGPEVYVTHVTGSRMSGRLLRVMRVDNREVALVREHVVRFVFHDIRHYCRTHGEVMVDTFDNLCRCDGTPMRGSDHCPECGCEEFEETCTEWHSDTMGVED